MNAPVAGSKTGAGGTSGLELDEELLESGADELLDGALLDGTADEVLLDGATDELLLDDGTFPEEGVLPLLAGEELELFPKQLVAKSIVEARTRSNFLLFILFPPFKVFCILFMQL